LLRKQLEISKNGCGNVSRGRNHPIVAAWAKRTPAVDRQSSFRENKGEYLSNSRTQHPACVTASFEAYPWATAAGVVGMPAQESLAHHHWMMQACGNGLKLMPMSSLIIRIAHH
jgi:hypothetical protein